jgi:hypothetical protein
MIKFKKSWHYIILATFIWVIPMIIDSLFGENRPDFAMIGIVQRFLKAIAIGFFLLFQHIRFTLCHRKVKNE